MELGDDAGHLDMYQVSAEPVTPKGVFSTCSRIDISDTGIKLSDHHKSIKNLFQEAGIPPWLRDSIPICRLDDELVAMGDWCISKEFASWLSEHNISLNWHPRNPLLKFILAQQH